MPESLPSEMRAIMLDSYNQKLSDAISSLRVVTLPVPRPGRGQVLVRIEAAPCNPSDLLFLRGNYVTTKALPTIPGREGAGTVVAAGGGTFARMMKGKRVACSSREDTDGTWAEYLLTDAKTCIPLKEDIDFEQGSTLLVNPLSAVGLLDTARRGGHRAALQTAGASQLGRMLTILACETGFPLVSVVSRQAQGDLLRLLGADHVLKTEDEDFDEKLRQTCAELNVTIGLEAVAGEMTGRILNAMPPESTVLLYGALSYMPCAAIDPTDFMFNNKRLDSFLLSRWINDVGIFRLIRASRQIQQIFASGQFRTIIQRRLSLDEVREGLMQYQERMTEGKVLIIPGLGAR